MNNRLSLLALLAAGFLLAGCGGATLSPGASARMSPTAHAVIQPVGGSTVSGTILADDAEGNAVVKVGEVEQVIPKDQIATRSEPVSAMPPMSALLSKKEVRDLVAYLASRQEDKAAEKHQ